MDLIEPTIESILQEMSKRETHRGKVWGYLGDIVKIVKKEDDPKTIIPI